MIKRYTQIHNLDISQSNDHNDQIQQWLFGGIEMMVFSVNAS